MIRINTEYVERLLTGPLSSSPPSVIGSSAPRDDSPVLVIDTNDDNGAKSYRDALAAKANTMGKHNIADIIIPKPNRIIVKMKTPESLEGLKKAIDKETGLNSLANIRVGKTRKKRLILFGAPDDITDMEFKREIESIEEIKSHEIDVVKNVPNRNGSKNYIIDVDNFTKSVLLDKQRVIINYNRVRIQKYISINRCYKCQQFGHVANNCRNPVRCGGCGEVHDTRNCKESDKECCINCKGERHRSDSKTCPAFLKYKRLRLNQED